MDDEVVSAGYQEREHTADWELEVWASDLAGLFQQAARGMYALSGTRLEAGPRVRRRVELRAADPESLLVTFLSELLFLGEDEELGFDRLDLQVTTGALEGHMEGAPIRSQDKEIKAVTFHNLSIREGPRGLEANIVFDV